MTTLQKHAPAKLLKRLAMRRKWIKAAWSVDIESTIRDASTFISLGVGESSWLACLIEARRVKASDRASFASAMDVFFLSLKRFNAS